MFQITLKTARELNGHTLEEAAKCLGMNMDNYCNVENDPSQIPLSLICEIVVFYGVAMSIIYPGTEAECIKHNQKLVINRGNN